MEVCNLCISYYFHLGEGGGGGVRLFFSLLLHLYCSCLCDWQNRSKPFEVSLSMLNGFFLYFFRRIYYVLWHFPPATNLISIFYRKKSFYIFLFMIGDLILEGVPEGFFSSINNSFLFTHWNFKLSNFWLLDQSLCCHFFFSIFSSLKLEIPFIRMWNYNLLTCERYFKRYTHTLWI